MYECSRAKNNTRFIYLFPPRPPFSLPPLPQNHSAHASALLGAKKRGVSRACSKIISISLRASLHLSPCHMHAFHSLGFICQMDMRTHIHTHNLNFGYSEGSVSHPDTFTQLYVREFNSICN